MSEEQVIDYDSMSDEEINNLPLPVEPADEEQEALKALQPQDDSEDVPNYDEDPAEDNDDDEEEADSEEGDESSEDSGSVEAGKEDEGSDDSDAAEASDDDVDYEGSSEGDDKVNSIEELLKTPLKVGDTEITVNSVEELVTLAQRGLGANKRMQDLAPKLKTLSMLESNGLLDQNKLNFLISLDKKDPAAIRKLVADSGVDVFDAGTGNPDEDYTPKDYSVSDEEYAVEQAFSDISTTSSYEATLKTLTSYDDASKAQIRKDPSILRELNEHHGNGIYEEIQKVVLKDRAMGNLEGMSDFEAYRHVWKTVQEYSASTAGGSEAGHKSLTNDSTSDGNLAGTEGTQEAGHKVKANKQVGKARSKARKAAEATNKSRGSHKADTINFDELTDEQIMAMDVNSL